MPKLLFVDTNIYLDFYRIRTDVKTQFLSHMEAIKDSLIVTDQVEMEFKKNRQAAILEGMKELKTPQKINVPSVLRQDKSSKAIDTNLTKMKDRIGKLRTRMGNVLENPSRYDKVYQVAQRLFIKRKEIDLYRKSKMRYKIRELAEKRFMLGYPPRKNNDNSIGDAINWEWIVMWPNRRILTYGSFQGMVTTELLKTVGGSSMIGFGRSSENGFTKRGGSFSFHCYRRH